MESNFQKIANTLGMDVKLGSTNPGESYEVIINGKPIVYEWGKGPFAEMMETSSNTGTPAFNSSSAIAGFLSDALSRLNWPRKALESGARAVEDVTRIANPPATDNWGNPISVEPETTETYHPGESYTVGPAVDPTPSGARQYPRVTHRGGAPFNPTPVMPSMEQMETILPWLLRLISPVGMGMFDMGKETIPPAAEYLFGPDGLQWDLDDFSGKYRPTEADKKMWEIEKNK
tara:strand:- start:1824 stop:2519 length:696 start_codon:yes stop_codon:yes gene_type:complete